MTKLLCAALLLALINFPLYAQVQNTATMDTSDVQREGKLTVGGYVDAYYGFNSSAQTNPYMVSSSLDNQVSINLAYVDVKYSSERVRARVVPGFGSYINQNYSNEPLTLKYLVEANAGICLSKKRGIWVDAGVLGSPYTNESAISKDHLMYTRSLAPEYVPYYLSGVKITIPIHAKWTFYGYFLNGWQVILDNNKQKSLGTQLEWKPNDQMIFNWNTYIANERAYNNDFQYRMRYFTDIFWIYQSGKRISATACAYIGIQNFQQLYTGTQITALWAQANTIWSYRFYKKHSIAARIEYFSDPYNIMLPQTNPRITGFRGGSAGLCLNIKPTDNAMIRLDGRYFRARSAVFQDADQRYTNQFFQLVANLTAWF